MSKCIIREQIGKILTNMGVNHTTKTYGQMVDEMMSNGVTIRQWISAHEFCPRPSSNFYLVRNKSGEVKVAKLDVSDGYANGKIAWVDPYGTRLVAKVNWTVEEWSPLDNNLDGVVMWKVKPGPNYMTSRGVKSVWRQHSGTGKYYCDNCRVAQHTSMRATCPDCGATMTNYAEGIAI